MREDFGPALLVWWQSLTSILEAHKHALPPHLFGTIIVNVLDAGNSPKELVLVLEGEASIWGDSKDLTMLGKLSPDCLVTTSNSALTSLFTDPLTAEKTFDVTGERKHLFVELLTFFSTVQL